MCGQVKTQLIDSKIQRHQLQQGTVYLWKAGPQLLVEGKIKAGKECALPQGLLRQGVLDVFYFFIAAAEASSFSMRARSLAASSRAPLTTASGALAIKP